MSERRDQEITQLIKQSKEKIKSKIPKEKLSTDPLTQEKTVEKYQADI